MDDLLTERLVLHPLTPAEAERVASGRPAAGDRWAPGYPTAVDVSGATAFVHACRTTGDPRPFGDYEIRRRSDGLAIGGTGFNREPDAEGTVTIGYGLIAGERGKGYAAEALRGLLCFARECGLAVVKGDADLGNIASQRVMLAVGMRYVGEDERVRYYEIAFPEDEPEDDAEGQAGNEPEDQAGSELEGQAGNVPGAGADFAAAEG